MPITKALATIDSTDDDSPNGTFEAILSAPTLDRDGDTLAADEWKTPLPDHITIDVDHGMNVASTVASATPSLDDDGNLRIKGSFSSIPRAQEVRTLITEGHIKTMSVAFMTDKTAKSAKKSRELLNGAFVAIPSNRESVILSSKALDEMTKAAAEAAPVEPAAAPKHDDMIQAVHDASVVLGAGCAMPGDDAGSGESEGANKAAPTMVIGSKSIVTKAVAGSLEDMQSAISSALDTAYGDSDARWSYIVATFMASETAGTIVYRLYTSGAGGVTLSRSYEIDADGTVSLGTEVTEVELITTTTIAEKSAGGDVTVRVNSSQPETTVTDREQFEAALAELDSAPNTSAVAIDGGSPSDSPDESTTDSPAETVDDDAAPSGPASESTVDSAAQSSVEDSADDEVALRARALSMRAHALQSASAAQE